MKVSIVRFLINKIKSGLGIVQDTDTATQAISKGKYVWWKGSLKKASANISATDTLSSSNLSDVSDGVLNELGGHMVLKIITPDNVSAFFTPKSGITMSNLTVKSKNGVNYVSCWISRNASWSSTEALDIGTIQSDYITCVSVPIATFDFFGLFADNGAIILKPHNNITANTNYDLVFSYPSNN